MSNLGLYQTMTQMAKKVGGPLKLGGLILVLGYAVFRSAEAGIKTVVKVIKKFYKNRQSIESLPVYTVCSQGVSNEGLNFEPGDKIRVIESVEDGVMIEKIGDTNNPYFVSIDLVESITNYRKTK